VQCAQEEYGIFDAPNGQTCGQYMSTFLSQNTGYVNNPVCRPCPPNPNVADVYRTPRPGVNTASTREGASTSLLSICRDMCMDGETSASLCESVDLLVYGRGRWLMRLPACSACPRMPSSSCSCTCSSCVSLLHVYLNGLLTVYRKLRSKRSKTAS
jgi:hypothetical protein